MQRLRFMDESKMERLVRLVDIRMEQGEQDVLCISMYICKFFKRKPYHNWQGNCQTNPMSVDLCIRTAGIEKLGWDVRDRDGRIHVHAEVIKNPNRWVFLDFIHTLFTKYQIFRVAKGHNSNSSLCVQGKHSSCLLELYLFCWNVQWYVASAVLM